MNKEELEKINKDYKEQLFAFDKERTELRTITHRVCKERRRLRRRNEELKKENAEFKEQLYAFDEEREKLRKENAELKRIVKMVAMINKDIYTEEGIKAIYAEAEQFLNSEVEK